MTLRRSGVRFARISRLHHIREIAVIGFAATELRLLRLDGTLTLLGALMNIEGKRVVVYAAHPTVIDVTIFRLELLGIDAIGVTSTEAMSQSLAAALPDAVLIDLDLDDNEGMRWTEKLAADECTSHIPILCLSSQGDLQEAEDAFKAGARAFLISPYDPIVLEDKLLALMEQAASNSEKAQVS